MKKIFSIILFLIFSINISLAAYTIVSTSAYSSSLIFSGIVFSNGGKYWAKSGTPIITFSDAIDLAWHSAVVRIKNGSSIIYQWPDEDANAGKTSFGYNANISNYSSLTFEVDVYRLEWFDYIKIDSNNSFTIYRDIAGPSISGLPVNNTIINDSSKTYTISASDAGCGMWNTSPNKNQLTYSWTNVTKNISGSGIDTDYNSVISMPLNAGEGEYVFTITAKDKLGNTRTATRTVYLDSTNPVINCTGRTVEPISNSKGDFYGDYPELTFTATDELTGISSISYQIFYPGGLSSIINVNSDTFSIDLAQYAQGDLDSFSIFATAWDNAGNGKIFTNYNDYEYHPRVDKQAPQIADIEILGPNGMSMINFEKAPFEDETVWFNHANIVNNQISEQVKVIFDDGFGVGVEPYEDVSLPENSRPVRYTFNGQSNETYTDYIPETIFSNGNLPIEDGIYDMSIWTMDLLRNGNSNNEDYFKIGLDTKPPTLGQNSYLIKDQIFENDISQSLIADPVFVNNTNVVISDLEMSFQNISIAPDGSKAPLGKIIIQRETEQNGQTVIEAVGEIIPAQDEQPGYEIIDDNGVPKIYISEVNVDLVGDDESSVVNRLNFYLEDTAGNISTVDNTFLSIPVVCDMVPPTLFEPDNFTINLDAVDDKFTFSWNGYEDGGKLTGIEPNTSFLWNITDDELALTDYQELSSNSIEVEFNKNNKEIKFGITAIDAAGNETLAEYSVYTSPSIVSIEDVMNIYQEPALTLHLDIKDSFPGTVDSVEIISINGDTEISPPYQVEFTSPHQPYSYKIKLKSAPDAMAGVEPGTISRAFIKEIDINDQATNNLPPKPVFNDEYDYLNGSTEIGVLNLVDEDGDGEAVTYLLKAFQDTDLVTTIDVSEPFSFDDLYSAGLTLDLLGTDVFTSGESYSLQVEAIDGWNGETVDSEYLSTFVFDSNPPVAELEYPDNGAFINSDSFYLVINEDEYQENYLTATYHFLDDVGEEFESGEIDCSRYQDIIYEFRSDLPIEFIEGKYTIAIEVQDGASNSTNKIKHVLVDKTAPVLADGQAYALFSNLDTVDVDTGYALETVFLTTNPVIKFDFTGKDNFSGIKEIKLGYDTGNESADDNYRVIEIEQNDLHNIAPAPTSEKEIIETLRNFSGKITPKIKMVDYAGNETEDWFELEYPLYLHTEKPKISIAVTGLEYADDENYVSSLENIAIQKLSSDDNILQYAISEFGYISTLEWFDYNNTVDNGLLSISDGTKYSLLVKVVDSFGLESDTKRFDFVYDSSNPVAGSVSITPSFTDIAVGESVVLSMLPTDLESGISEVALKIGLFDAVNNSVGTELSENLDGASQDGELISNEAPFKFRFKVPLDIDTNEDYCLEYNIKNNAGLITKYISTEYLSISELATAINVDDYGRYVGIENPQNINLKFHWNCIGINEALADKFEYCVIEGSVYSAEGWSEIPGAALTGSYEVSTTASGAQLVEGVEYSVLVRVLDDQDHIIDVGQSSGVVFDTTAPLLGEVEGVSGLLTEKAASEDGVKIKWSFTDSESEIKKIEACISVDEDGVITPIPYGEGPQIWQEISNKASVSNYYLLKNLNLANYGNARRLYVTLRATNKAEMPTEVKSGVIILDKNPPSIPIIQTTASFIIPPSIEQNGSWPEFNWIHSQGDAESEVEYGWQLAESIDSISENYLNDTEDDKKVDEIEYIQKGYTDNDLLFTNGNTIYAVVRAEDSVGHDSIGVSESITFDSDAPEIKSIIIDNDSYIDYENINVDLSVFELSTFQVKGRISKLNEESEYLPLTEWSVPNSESNLDFDLTGLLLPGDIIVAQIVAVDEPGNESQQANSSAVLFDNRPIEVLNINGVASGNFLHFDWDFEECFIPLDSVYTALVEAGVEPEAEDWILNENSYSRDIVLSTDGSMNLDDGIYELNVKASNILNPADFSNPESSLPIIVDRAKPVITEVDYPDYTYEILDFSISASDGDLGSGVEEYQYAIGTEYNPITYTGEWINVQKDNPVDSYKIKLYYNIDNYEDDPSFNYCDSLLNPIPGDFNKIVLRVRAKDKAGYWSDVYKSEEIVVDRTAPELSTFSAIRFTNDENIENVQIDYLDEESPIDKYQFGYYIYHHLTEEDPLNIENLTEDDFAFDDNSIISIADPENALNYMLTVIIGSSEFENDDSIVLCVRARNKAGIWSDISKNNGTVVDTIAPDVTIYDELSNELGENSRIILNTLNEDWVDKSVFWDVSNEIADLTFSYKIVDRNDLNFTIYNSSGNTIIFSGSETEEIVLDGEMFPDLTSEGKKDYYLSPGSYRLFINVTDIAGNTTAVVPDHLAYLDVKINKPPVFDIINTLESTNSRNILFVPLIGEETTQDVTGSAEVPEINYLKILISDSDESGLDTVVWGWSYEESSSDERTFAENFCRADGVYENIDFNVTFSATDDEGGKYTEILPVKVKNTTIGPLYGNEWWNGNHNFGGPIEVSSGIVLTINPGTTVFAPSKPQVGETRYQDFIIEGEIICNYSATDQKISFLNNTYNGQTPWLGLYIDGIYTLNNVLVSDAHRGITLTNNSSAQNDLPITYYMAINNNIGIHVYGANPIIQNSTFTNNKWYGIKEDYSAVTEIDDCEFSGNGYDFYEDSYLDEDTLTVLSDEELNDLNVTE